jgi:hypothetical protein
MAADAALAVKLRTGLGPAPGELPWPPSPRRVPASSASLDRPGFTLLRELTASSR